MSQADRIAAARYRQAAPATLDALYKAFKARMELVVAAFWGFSTKSDAKRSPILVDGWLPPKPDAGVEEFPFVAIRPRLGEDSEQSADENSRAQLDVIIGTYSDTDDGWLEVLQVIAAIRNDIHSAPAIDGTAFEHVGPLRWEIPQEQPRPQWFGTVQTNWSLPRPPRVEALNPEA